MNDELIRLRTSDIPDAEFLAAVELAGMLRRAATWLGAKPAARVLFEHRVPVALSDVDVCMTMPERMTVEGDHVLAFPPKLLLHKAIKLSRTGRLWLQGERRNGMWYTKRPVVTTELRRMWDSMAERVNLEREVRDRSAD